MYIEKSKMMAARLKELRKARKLSHEKLAVALQNKYGISISKDSLVAYEAPCEGHTRFGSNMRMSVEYIICLADYYGVTTDYLLVNTDDPSIKPAVRTETGLSAKAVQNLAVSKGNDGSSYNSVFVVNSLLETYSGTMLINNINKCFFAHIAKIAYDDLCDVELSEALGKTDKYMSQKERYEWVASYLSANPLGKSVADVLILLRDMRYSQKNANIDIALLYEYGASTALSKHCEEYAQITWGRMKNELKVHYKFTR